MFYFCAKKSTNLENVSIFCRGKQQWPVSSNWTRLFSMLISVETPLAWCLKNPTSYDTEGTPERSPLPVKSEKSLRRRRHFPIGVHFFRKWYTFSGRGTLCCSLPTGYTTVVGVTGKISSWLGTVSTVSTPLHFYRWCLPPTLCSSSKSAGQAQGTNLQSHGGPTCSAPWACCG